MYEGDQTVCGSRAKEWRANLSRVDFLCSSEGGSAALPSRNFAFRVTLHDAVMACDPVAFGRGILSLTLDVGLRKAAASGGVAAGATAAGTQTDSSSSAECALLFLLDAAAAVAVATAASSKDAAATALSSALSSRFRYCCPMFASIGPFKVAGVSLHGRTNTSSSSACATCESVSTNWIMKVDGCLAVMLASPSPSSTHLDGSAHGERTCTVHGLSTNAIPDSDTETE